MDPSEERSLKFMSRTGPRYGWFRVCSYVPPTLSYLTKEEWQLILDWFDDTEKKKLIGEAGQTIMNLLQGFIMGNNVCRIVQCGHYSGFSSIMIGYMLKKMGHKNGLLSFDIDANVTKYANEWIKKAGLSDYVSLVVNDSAHQSNPTLSKEYLGGKPQLVFIDSSHQYEHTLKELDLWYNELEYGGFLILHDVSTIAQDYDTTKKGGVKRAIDEWSAKNKVAIIKIFPRILQNEKRSKDESDLTWLDPCGVAIIQK